VVGASGSGCVVPAGDPQTLAGALRMILDGQIDVSAMGRRGLETVRTRHSMDSFTAETARIYRDALSAAG
jgi:glycosyltransferase involved in cell wall biosynthesis